MENQTKLYQLIAIILSVEPHTITEQSSPDNIPEWDSLNGIMMVTELEKPFNVKFTMDEVMAVQNVKDIKDSLRKHGVQII